MSGEKYTKVTVSPEVLYQQVMQGVERERHRINQLSDKINTIISGSKKDAQKENKREASHIVLSNISNNTIEEVVTTGFVEKESNIKLSVDKGVKLSAIDISSTLEMSVEDETMIEKKAYIEHINTQLMLATVYDEEERKLKNDFVKYVNSLIADDFLEWNYFKSLVDIRFDELRKKLKIEEVSFDNEETVQYYSLCNLLNVKPEALSGKNQKEEVERLMELYSIKKKEEYIAKSFEEVFEEMGIEISETTSLDGLSGNFLTAEDIPECSIFMSKDKRGILFETVAENVPEKGMSNNQKAKIEEAAARFCDCHQEIIRRMKVRGIDISIEYCTEPKIENIHKRTDIIDKRILKKKAQERHIGG